MHTADGIALRTSNKVLQRAVGQIQASCVLVLCVLAPLSPLPPQNLNLLALDNAGMPYALWRGNGGPPVTVTFIRFREGPAQQQLTRMGNYRRRFFQFAAASSSWRLFWPLKWPVARLACQQHEAHPAPQPSSNARGGGSYLGPGPRQDPRTARRVLRSERVGTCGP